MHRLKNISKLSIVIPVYNEELYVGTILSKITSMNLASLNLEKEVIVIDDGSTDNSFNICKNYKDIKIIQHVQNRGKGAAIKTGLKYASGNIILIQDADLEYDPGDYLLLLEPILDERASVVYGSRFLNKPYPEGMSWVTFLANKIGTFLINKLYGSNITDEATGYKLFRSEAIKHIDIDNSGFEFCVEITAKVLKNGFKIYDVPISYKARNCKNGKKFKWYHGISILKAILKYRYYKPN